VIWLLVVIKKKKWKALKAGIIFGFCVYMIDAVFWWNIPAGPLYPGANIREYVIGGVQMPNPLGGYFLLKFGADFMMTFSYSLFAFTWLWIIFENFEKRDFREIGLFSGLYFCSWMLIPFISILLPINDTLVHSVRHMDTQIIAWLVNVVVGYVILAIFYGTNIVKKKNPKMILYVFVVGCVESFYMEFPLFISGIRPTNVPFLIYEIFCMFNQGAPYLYILWDVFLPKLKEKFLPKIKEKLPSLSKKKTENS
jgi:hypothetical protein